MKKLLLLCVITAASALAAATTVTGPVYMNGVLATGRLEISWPAFRTSAGVYQAAGFRRVIVTAGVMSVSLEPIDETAAVTPREVFYTVRELFTNGTQGTKYMIVPTSGSPVVYGSIVVLTPPNWIYLSQILVPIGTGNLWVPTFNSTTGLLEMAAQIGGGGVGDFNTNTSTSVDGEILLFSGPLGKTGKRATITGLLKGTAGVLGAAVAGTDYENPLTFPGVVTRNVNAIDCLFCAQTNVAYSNPSFVQSLAASKIIGAVDLATQISGLLPAASFPAVSGDVAIPSGTTVSTIGALKVTNAMLAGSIAFAKLVGTDIAITGLQVSNTPAGNIAASTAQAAINELDTEKSPIANPTFTGTVTGAFSGNLTGNVTGNASGTAASITGNLTGDVPSVGMVTSVTKRGTGTRFQMAGSVAPSTDDCAKFDASGNLVSAGAGCNVSGGNAAADFSSSTTWTYQGVTHALNTCDLTYTVYENSGTQRKITQPNAVLCETAAGGTQYDITVTWASAQAGRLVLLKSGGAATGGGSSPVSSVFTRIGTVVAVSGDYTAAQVTNAVDSTSSYSNPSWITALAASKLSGAIPAGNFPALTGDVTNSPGSLATTIANLAVTNAKLAGSIATAKLLTVSGAGGTVVISSGVPADGCAQWASGNLGTTGSACGSGSGSGVALKNNGGVATTARGTLNLIPGAGIGPIVISDTGTQLDVTIPADTGVVLTQADPAPWTGKKSPTVTGGVAALRLVPSALATTSLASGDIGVENTNYNLYWRDNSSQWRIPYYGISGSPCSSGNVLLAGSNFATGCGTTTGSGSIFVLASAPTLLLPDIASFVNANHLHASAAGGGFLTSGTAFTAQTSITITGATHARGTQDLNIACWDNSSPRNLVIPNRVTVNSSTFDVTITFLVAETGRCAVI